MNYPKAIGPYSVYRQCGDIIFISGQIPVNPNSGNIETADVKEQTKQCLKNIGAILKKLSLNYKNVVKTMIFIDDMSNFASVNEVYATFFNEPFPARSCVAVKEIPKGAKVEIEVIVIKNIL
ncbi:Rid family detoxifying hydrolase [Campylobacter geochelonis]|uniref:Endoribonuclease L-PSP n=1 Tax=Campylobacter geochelonis TaxID=1780362 RepID=A0A128ELD2_9BACT|nr:Rid family detoxifying hydrolase [Campylobacter geochelonis]QKF71797.1 flagella modification protein [Campylobacter geochelonis]CZE47500.1 Endoribonuclease L-PSP [Campylobacter geochelonis]CZE49361.1 Endoribonuclease L-PSP [Campylobacter geochelonis]CZE51450.1 Endoribonuclease L-PSP [Campylobacter geochelonis]